MEGKVSRACLLYIRKYLSPGIRNLDKPAAMDKLMPFPDKINTDMLKVALILITPTCGPWIDHLHFLVAATANTLWEIFSTKIM